METIKIGIVSNKKKEQCKEIVEKLSLAIEREGAIPLYGSDDTYVYENADMLISIGGDGTFLKVAANGLKRDIPIIGINLGTLGFLTEIEKHDIDVTVKRLVSKDYVIEERKVMQTCITNRDKEVFCEFALNDCVIARNILSKVLYLNVYINGYFVDTYPGDGVILSTQTGSTAYSLSAGGPIVEPGNEVIVFTPLSAHMVEGRSIILNKDSVIEIKLSREHNEAYAICDGHTSRLLDKEDIITCRLMDKYIKIIRIDPPDFYSVLKKKNAKRQIKICDDLVKGD